MTETKLHLHGKPVEGFVELHEHISPVSTYMKVFGALLVLTALTYAVSYMSLGPASLPVAMIVAVAKASLVCMFFMHLKWEANWKYVLTIPAMMMSVFLVCMLIPDVGMRQLKYAEERIIHAAQANVSNTHGESHLSETPQSGAETH